MPFSPDEKKFTWFWIAIFGSAIGFWIITIHAVIGLVQRYI